MHSCLRVCTVRVMTAWISFHSSSVSPSKGTASFSMWMPLGSLLPIQPIGVRLKEGLHPISCWYTTVGSGSAASASGIWNFMNWLALSKPPKGMANLGKRGERNIKAPLRHKSIYEVRSGWKYLLKLLYLGRSFRSVGPGIPALRVAIRISSPFMAFSHGDMYPFRVILVASSHPPPVEEPSRLEVQLCK